MGAPAQAIDWEGLAESGVLCRALVDDPSGFVANNRNALDRYWRADSLLSADGATLQIGREAELYWVALRETRDGDHMRLSCAVHINPAWLTAADLKVLMEWNQSWVTSVVASPDYSSGQTGEIVKNGLNARGCVVAMGFDNDPKNVTINSIVYETADVAGCGGPPVLETLQNELGR